jgi:very-short-patch-repair endonuclease
MTIDPETARLQRELEEKRELVRKMESDPEHRAEYVNACLTRWAAFRRVDAPRPASPLDLCESPIESALCRAMLRALPPDAALVAQVPVLHYRLYFAVTGPNGLRVAVECDGHDFHERTKEQAERDRRRDRDLQTEGWRVLRFTGSEIHRSAAGCAAQVADAIEAWKAAG